MADDTSSEGNFAELQVDFWFEPAPSVEDVFWPVPLAIAWISWREDTTANAVCEQVRQVGRSYWLDPQLPEPAINPRQAEQLLLEALQMGEVIAFGLPTGSDRRESIEHFQWIDLRLFGSTPFDQLENAVSSTSAKVIFADVKLAASAVKRVWPIDKVNLAEKARRVPGPAPKTWRRVHKEMKSFSLEELNQMKGVEMATRFGASDTLCYGVRRQITVEAEEN